MGTRAKPKVPNLDMCHRINRNSVSWDCGISWAKSWTCWLLATWLHILGGGMAPPPPWYGIVMENGVHGKSDMVSRECQPKIGSEVPWGIGFMSFDHLAKLHSGKHRPVFGANAQHNNMVNLPTWAWVPIPTEFGKGISQPRKLTPKKGKLQIWTNHDRQDMIGHQAGFFNVASATPSCAWMHAQLWSSKLHVVSANRKSLLGHKSSKN